MTEEETERFEVNTKGICILCFRNCSKRSEDSSTFGTQFTSCMRYLGVNLNKVCVFPGCEDEVNSDLELVVSLCDQCDRIGNKFTSLFEQLEKIKGQIDSCCTAWLQLMEEGGNNHSRIMEYRSKMRTGNPLGLFHAAIAEKLRKEAISKCSEKINSKGKDKEPNPGTKSDLELIDNFQALTPEPNPTLSQPLDEPADFDDQSDQLLLPPVPPLDPLSSDFDESQEEQVFLPVPTPDSFSADTDPLEDVSTPLIKPDPDPSPVVHFSSSTTVKSAFLNTTSNDKKYTCATCSKSFSSMTNLRSHGKLAHGSINAAVVKTLTLTQDQTNICKSCVQCSDCGLDFPDHLAVVNHKLAFHGGLTNNDSKIICKYCQKQFTVKKELLNHSIHCHGYEVFSKYLAKGVPQILFQQIFDQLLNEVEYLPGNNYACLYCNYTTLFTKQCDIKVHLVFQHTEILLGKLGKEFGPGNEDEFRRFEMSRSTLCDDIISTSLQLAENDGQSSRNQHELLSSSSPLLEVRQKKRRRIEMEQLVILPEDVEVKLEEVHKEIIEIE